MTTTRQWLLILLIAGLGAMAGFWLTRTVPLTCAQMGNEALISRQAAHVCTSQLVGCSLNYAEVRTIVAQTDRAERCKKQAEGSP